ncbi:MAG: deoxycytidylate deaminase [Candidatus Woesearchaeota archaeon]
MDDHKRPSWDEYFMNIVMEIGSRGTCDRGRTGCVIVKDHRILASGYVGSPPGLDHCDESGHILRKVTYEDGEERMHCVRTIHAELNAICAAARYGISLDGSTVYMKLEPCEACARALIAVGVKRVVCAGRYHGAKRTLEMLKQVGVEVKYLSEEVIEYKDQKK